MRRVYVDSSVVVAILLDEPGAGAMARKLAAYELLSSPLLEGEVRAALTHEGVSLTDPVFDAFGWVLPQRALSAEIARVLSAGRVRGAEVFHLACALHVFGDLPGNFLTLDAAQREVAEKLGFGTAF